IQTDHQTVFHASTREMTGEARKKRSGSGTPAQNSVAKRIPPKTIADPRSGCNSTINAGTDAMTIGANISRMEPGGSRRAANHRASIRIVASFANSTGWIRAPPMPSHELVPSAVPEPVPITSVSASRKSPNAYSQGAAHSYSRNEMRDVTKAATNA